MNPIYMPLSPSSRDIYLKTAPLFGKALLALRAELMLSSSGITYKELEDLWSLRLRENLTFFTDTKVFARQKNHLGEEFGRSLCVSAEKCVAHGKNISVLSPGNLVTIDAGVAISISGGRQLVFDAAFTCIVGQEDIPLVARAPLDALKEIARLQGDVTQRAIAQIIQEHAWRNGLSIVTALVGHGIGYSMHEWPGIPNAVLAGTSSAKLPCDILINPEPMYVKLQGQKVADVFIGEDGWSVITSGPSAHWETTFYYDGKRLHDIVGITGVE